MRAQQRRAMLDMWVRRRPEDSTWYLGEVKRSRRLEGQEKSKRGEELHLKRPSTSRLSGVSTLAMQWQEIPARASEGREDLVRLVLLNLEGEEMDRGKTEGWWSSRS